MLSYSFITFAVCCGTLAQAHGVIINAQGEKGSPASVGFQVDPALARNCTTISPCQQDTTIIRDAEIISNVVNECGRTELTGNIDVGENTENALAAGAVTSVKAGTVMAITIHQVNADGAGPYVCDLDPTGNSLGATGQQNLTVTNNIPGVNGFSQAKAEDFVINVAMPADLACTGGSTGNICTVRCRNNALAGPFGGCIAVQQIDVKASVNSANTITTAQTLDGVNSQIASNVADLPAAIKANQDAGADGAAQNLAAVNALLGTTIVSKAAAVQTVAVVNNGNASVATATSAATTTSAATATATAKASKNGANTKGTKNANNNNNKRSNSFRFARRMVVSNEAPSDLTS